VINRADIFALEEAMRLKAKGAGTEVLALSVGPESANEGLRYCLARGADLAWRIWDEGIRSEDPYMVAGIIAQAAKRSGSSLILCGFMSDDSRSAIAPALTAEKLNWPWINRAVTVTLEEKSGTLTILQRGERGSRLEVSCPFPALLAFDSALSGYQYVSIRRREAAENRSIQVFNLNNLEGHQDIRGISSPLRVLKVRLPKPRTKRALVSSQQLSGEDMMWQMISGPSTKTEKDHLIRGEPVDLARSILEFLAEKGFPQPSSSPKLDTREVKGC
jgi:electron transfer flavoprotein beta subunit